MLSTHVRTSGSPLRVGMMIETERRRIRNRVADAVVAVRRGFDGRADRGAGQRFGDRALPRRARVFLFGPAQRPRALQAAPVVENARDVPDAMRLRTAR